MTVCFVIVFPRNTLANIFLLRVSMINIWNNDWKESSQCFYPPTYQTTKDSLISAKMQKKNQITNFILPIYHQFIHRFSDDHNCLSFKLFLCQKCDHILSLMTFLWSSIHEFFRRIHIIIVDPIPVMTQVFVIYVGYLFRRTFFRFFSWVFLMIFLIWRRVRNL